MGGTRSVHLIGRDIELDQLRRAAAEARSGNTRVVLVDSEPGIGKTRLVAQLEAELRGSP